MSMEMQQVQRPEQRMIMTPQMQQAIHLLQAPLQEMSLIIRQEMVSNPLLEEAPPLEEPSPAEPPEKESPLENGELEFREEFDHLARLDDDWREFFLQSGSAARYQEPDEEKIGFMESSISRGETLSEHILSQLLPLALSDRDRKIGEAIIGSIDDNGYLTESVEEIARAGGTEPEAVAAVLKIIQKFSPTGLGSRDLRECLLLQVESRDNPDPLARQIVEEHLDELGRKKYPQIARALKTTPERVQKAAEFIATLDPKPGRVFSQEEVSYITPDIYLEKADDDYQIVFNSDYLPHLRLNKKYRDLMDGQAADSVTRDYIKEKVKAGLWLIKNIRLRQETLRKVTEELVRRQRQFLDKGPQYLVPLKMSEIARAVGIHESTVSRAVANKHIQTAQGIFPMKQFFATALSSPGGGEVASPRVKESIAKLIKEEDPLHPLSDQAIEGTLAQRGIKLARRTVTKYRKALHLLPSYLRKRF